MSSTASVGGSNSAYATSTSRRIDRLVSRADQNGDGQISLSEFSTIGQNLPGSSATSSTSGSATTATTAASAATGSATAGADRSALFSQIDANGDGQLSTDELSTYKQQQVTAARTALLNIQEAFGGGSDGGGRTDGAGGTGRAHHGHHHRASQAPTDASTDGQGDAATASATTSTTDSASAGTDPVSAFFGAVDANSDGAISKAELSSFVTQLFSRLGSATQGGASAVNASASTASATA